MKSKTTVLIIAGLVLAAMGLWLMHVMPLQGWAVRTDTGGGWELIAEGWAVLWRGWPLSLLGLVIGGGLAMLAWPVDRATDADHAAEIQRLTGERNAALAARDRARAEAEAVLAEDLAEVERLRAEALRAREAGHQAQIDARRQIEAARADIAVKSAQIDALHRSALNVASAARRKLKKAQPS